MKKSLQQFLAPLLTVALVATALSGCKEEDLTYTGEVEMPEDANLLELQSGSYSIPFEIRSDTDWRIDFDGELAYAHPSKGTGDATIKLCIQPNPTEEDREGVMYVVFPNAPEKNKTYRLVQPFDFTLDGAITSNSRFAVGFGYNIAGEYASPGSVKGEILRYQQLYDVGFIEDNNSSANFHTEIITGSSAIDIANELRARASYATSFSNAFSAEVGATMNTSLFSKNEIEYALTIANVERHDLRVNLNRDQILEYMTDGAYNAINGLRKNRKGELVPSTTYTNTPEGIKRLVDDYGTHLIMKARLGGRLTYAMSADLSQIEGAFELTAYAKMNYSNDLILKSEGGAEVSDALKASYKNNRKALNIRMLVKGGSGTTVSALSEYGKDTNATVNEWKKSLENIENCALVELSDDDCMIPLWELVDPDEDPDGTRRSAIKDYFDNYFLRDFPSVAMLYSNGTAVHIANIPKFSESDVRSSLIKDVYNGGQHVARICNEYIPVINKKQRVTVIYPVINNKTKWNMGYFIGENGSHSPARVCWTGSSVTVTELDSKAPLIATKDIYIRGSQFSNTIASPEVQTVNGKVEDMVLADRAYDASQRAVVDHNYPLVKILTRIWTRENWTALSTHESGALLRVPAGSTIRKKWGMPYEEDFKEIYGTLAAQNVTEIQHGKTFFPDANSGVLGFHAYGGNGYVDSNYKWNIISDKANVYACVGYLNSGGRAIYKIWDNRSSLTIDTNCTVTGYVTRYNSSIYDN